MKDAAIAPPGVTPSQQPMAEDRDRVANPHANRTQRQGCGPGDEQQQHSAA